MAYVRKEMRTDVGNRTVWLFSYIKGKATPVERVGTFEVQKNVYSGKQWLTIRDPN